MARWVIGLFAVGVIGGTVLMALGIPDILKDLDADPARTILTALIVVVGVGALLVVMPAYFLSRHLRGIPLITVDSRGVMLGGDWNQDLAVEWSNVRQIRLRQANANGIRDVHVLFDLADDGPLRARVRNLRQRGTIATNRMMFGVPFGLSTAYVGGGSAAVMEAIGRHFRGSVVPA